MSNLAIKGHPTRGKDVIGILEMLGGKDEWFIFDGDLVNYYHYIGNGNNIYRSPLSCIDEKNTIVFTLEEFLEKYPYKVGDKVTYANSTEKYYIISNMYWKWDMVIYDAISEDKSSNLESYSADKLQPYKEENKMKYKVGDKIRIKSLDWYNKNKNEKEQIVCDKDTFIKDMATYCGRILTIKDIKKCKYMVEENIWNWTDEMIEGLVNEEQNEVDCLYITNGGSLCSVFTDGSMCLGSKSTISKIVFNDCKDDEIELDLGNDYLLEYKDGKPYITRKKSKYPKTYEECCKILGINSVDNDNRGYRWELLCNLQELLILRDAYWKLADNWKPNWKDDNQEKWAISFYKDGVYFTNRLNRNCILVFPSEEMRDAFYENFKDLIEECKELL